MIQCCIYLKEIGSVVNCPCLVKGLGAVCSRTEQNKAENTGTPQTSSNIISLHSCITFIKHDAKLLFKLNSNLQTCI